MTWIDAAKSRCDKATPGPWTGDRFNGTVKYEVQDPLGNCVLNVDQKNGDYGFTREDDELFMLRSREDLPFALEALASVAAVFHVIRAVPGEKLDPVWIDHWLGHLARGPDHAD